MQRVIDFMICLLAVVGGVYLAWLVFFGITIGPERLNMAEILLQAITRIG